MEKRTKSIKKIKNNLILTIRLLLKFKKRYLICLCLLTIISSILPYVSMLLSQDLLNYLQLKNELLNNIIIILIVYLLINIFTQIASSLSSYIMKKYTDYLYCELNIFFRKECTYLSYQDFENENIYDSLQRAEQQIGVRPVAVVTDILGLLSTVISFFISMVILSVWHPWIILGFLILPFLSYKHFVEINKFEYENITERTEIERKSWYLTHLLIKDYFIKEIKLLNVSDYILLKYNKILKRIYSDNILINKKKSIFNFLYQLSNLIFSFVIIIISFFETYSGNLLIGNFMTNINTTSKIEGAISGIVNSCFSIYNDCLYVGYIFDFLEIIKIRKKSMINNGVKIDEIQSIKLNNVSYKYRNSEKYVLQNINLTINTNDTIALVGENGSGKTTLIKIITGLYTDYEGEIFINNINIRNIDINELRNKMSVIFQDYNNYEFSVYENIGLGDINNIGDFNKVKFAAQLANVDNLIESFPNKYNQQLGNWFKNGIQLSGGQWQKIAIARTLMRSADIYILDEPTAALDPSSEYKFFKNFINVVHTNIRMFVTHRFTNASISNRIIFLKQGKIVEEGTHKELMDLNGEYARLYKIQIGEEL